MVATKATTAETMRAVQGKDYGDIDKMLSVEEGVAMPHLDELFPKVKKRKEHMILKVHAVALAPGDVRVLSGKTKEFQGPPSFPYIPGGDCCGTVVELSDDDNKLPFRVGDLVAARFADGPRGALGEYACVSTVVADKVPKGITSVQAAALVGASPATVLAGRIDNTKDERVLVLGARGGMGSTFCQAIKLNKPSLFVVGVSRDPDTLTKSPIGCDEAIDYTTTDVFSLEKYKRDKFDVIVDLAGGGYHQLEDCVQRGEDLIVKTAAQGGRFITTVPPVGPTFELHTIPQIVKTFMLSLLWKALTSRTWKRSKLPAYTFGMSLPMERESVSNALQLGGDRKLEAVIDSKGPFPFTTEGVRAAFHLQESRHAHGKVMIQVCSEVTMNE